MLVTLPVVSGQYQRLWIGVVDGGSKQGADGEAEHQGAEGKGCKRGGYSPESKVLGLFDKQYRNQIQQKYEYYKNIFIGNILRYNILTDVLCVYE